MTLPRYAAKQDDNAAPLVELARRMGCYVKYLGKPVDLLLHDGANWRLVEIKDPDKEGHADEFTKDQKKFLADIAPYGAEVWVWRTKQDVQRDLGALRRDLR